MKKNVQDSSSRSYLLIGSGRLSRHLQFYFHTIGLHFDHWDRQKSVETLDRALEKRPTVLLAISDQALQPFFDTHLKKRDLVVVHFSGALHLPGLIACHPLMSFADRLFPNEFYPRIGFAVTGTSSLQDCLPELPNPSFPLRPEEKALYHAWCVLAAAGTQTLWKAARAQLMAQGVPSASFDSYLQQIAENFIRDPEHSLTGPWARNDRATIQKNEEALSGASRELYSQLRKGLS
ncbi:MAG: DUF2520 domain-containing protein [Bdellovibrionales bacterium]